jgi:uncharacterized protein YdcH (DUF465 family)
MELQRTVDLASKQDQMDELLAEHRVLQTRLRELDRHISLTSAERVEYAQLKKLELQAKDRMRTLAQHAGRAETG